MESKKSEEKNCEQRLTVCDPGKEEEGTANFNSSSNSNSIRLAGVNYAHTENQSKEYVLSVSH